MTKLIALDTETTGLEPGREDVFEVATVDLASGDEKVWRIEPRPHVVAAMHPKAAEVNRYHERIADPDWQWGRAPATAAAEIAWVLDGAHIVGAVPDFDTRHLTAMFRRFRVEPPWWHYHLIDVETMAVGWLHGKHAGRGLADEHGNDAWVSIELPWRSDDLSRWCGVEPPSDGERHTALGDARWVARLYRHLTGGDA